VCCFKLLLLLVFAQLGSALDTIAVKAGIKLPASSCCHVPISRDLHVVLSPAATIVLL
jgi:hypothetical protein